MGENDEIRIPVRVDDREAQDALDKLEKKIEKTAAAVEKTSAKRNGIVTALDAAKTKAQETKSEIDRANAALEFVNKKIAEGKSPGGTQTAGYTMEEYNKLLNYQAQLRDLQSERVKQYESQTKEVDKLSAQEQKISATLSEQTKELRQQKAAAGEIEKVIAKQSRSAMPQLKAAMDQANTSINKGFKSILKWGFGIRSVFILVRRLKNYVREAVLAFAEQDEETKNNIASLKSALQGLKLSWGAAFAPIFNAVVPILQKLISWLTAAANAIAAFFSALGGKATYKRAVAGANAVADSYGAAGAAAKEAKKQIMGFDEINQLNGNDTGGGGGGAGGGGVEMEEVPISDKILKMAKLLRDHFKEIAIAAGIIGAAIAAWKIAKFIRDTEGLLPIFNKVLGVIMIIAGAVLLVKNYFDAWQNGVDWDNLTGILVGLALLVGGMTIVFSSTAGAITLLIGSFFTLCLAIKDWRENGELGTQTAVLLAASLLGIGVAIGMLTGSMGIGLLIAGIGMLIAGIIDWVKTGELGDQAFYMMEVAIGVVGVALTLLIGGPIPLLIAAVAALALAIYKHWDDIKQWTGDLTAKIKTKFEEVKSKFSGIIDSIKSKAKAAVSFLKSIFNFHWKLPDLKLPHIVVGNYIDVPVLGRIPDPKSLRVEWYKRGGIFDKPSLIGVGEAGKEAVMPLEHNTAWIKDLAEQILNAMDNKYAGALNGLPAMAMGGVVPPRAMSGSTGISSEDVASIAAAIAGALGGNSGKIEIDNKLYIDGKQVSDVVTRYQRRNERAMGW